VRDLARSGSAGHFVKMVHNGIEYGVMQLIAETYDLMKRGWGMNDDEVHEVYASWNKGELNGYLVEITSHIFSKQDEKTGKRLIDEILDVAKQNGTGMWTSQSAMELQVPIPTIDLAVAMRDMSVFEGTRAGRRDLSASHTALHRRPRSFLTQLGRALFAGMIITYAQGMALLAVASDKYKYHLDLEAVARIWRGGCIIRAALLETSARRFAQARSAEFAAGSQLVAQGHGASGRFAPGGHAGGRVRGAGPALMVSLGYLDAYRSAWQPANLIQAQRDYFGSTPMSGSMPKARFTRNGRRNEDHENKRPTRTDGVRHFWRSR
jgi:6-phosphogluconate dehydrogenase